MEILWPGALKSTYRGAHVLDRAYITPAKALIAAKKAVEATKVVARKS